MILAFTVLFFKYDYSKASETMLIDYFFMAILFCKVYLLSVITSVKSGQMFNLKTILYTGSRTDILPMYDKLTNVGAASHIRNM